MQYFSFHTHSDFCDGKTSVDAVCKNAIDKGVSAVGFSSHAPVPFETKWAMHFQNLEAYVAEINRCKEKYKDHLEVYRALEADYISPNRSIPFDVWRQMGHLDYIIGSVHLVANPELDNAIWFLDGPVENYKIGLNACFNGDIKKGVTQYYKQMQEMVISQKPDLIAHMDKVVMNNKDRFFSESESWYQNIQEETLQTIATAGTVIEVNTRGIYRGKYHTFFPNENIIKRCIELKIPLTVSVDAHHPEELTSEYDRAIAAIRHAGGSEISIFSSGQWEQKSITDVMSL